ncbi:MAG: glucoamylase family protein [Candidatus Eisenbacteria bacterium]
MRITAIASLLPVLVLGLLPPTTDAAGLKTEELLDELQERAFLYFWNEGNPSNGLVRDRSTSWSPLKMAATGFGFSAICIGIDRGWVTREAGRDRILTALRTLWTGPQGPEPSGNIGYKGFFYHFVDFETAVRTWNSDLAPIDTALLFAGIIDAKQYFSTADSLDTEVRCLADSILYRADWSFMYDGLGIALTWTPEEGFPDITWLGYNEAMIMYILAIGSPTHPIPAETWNAWTGNYGWQTHYGYSFVNFPPLFGHQYSHCWIDFRNIQDAYMREKETTYHENSVRAARAQQAYCIDNPLEHIGYSGILWGLTASDGPDGYAVHGAPPAVNDDGTIAPTAAAGSIPFAPDIVIPTLHNLYDVYGHMLWGPYGFRDAFNLDRGWWGTDYIGIDQGPIIVMIENYRTQAVWNRLMQDPDVQRGLLLAGFQSATAVEHRPFPASRSRLFPNTPNPFNPATEIRYVLAEDCRVRLTVHDVRGRFLATLADIRRPAGDHSVPWDGRIAGGTEAASGAYFVRLEAGGEVLTRKLLLVR